MRLDDAPAEVVAAATRLRNGLLGVFGDRLLGYYLFGSVATGAYEAGTSDIDTLAVLASDAGDDEVAVLERMHESLVLETPEWRERIEVVYASRDALAASLSGSAPAARISPGEPLHRIEIDRRWVMDWYQVLAASVALQGPPPSELVPPITRTDFIEAIGRDMVRWPERVAGGMDASGRTYTVLTVCRGLRLLRTGEHVSKREAATWAAREFPEYANLIDQALEWRSTGGAVVPGPGMEETNRFVEGVCAAEQRALVRSGYDAISYAYKDDDGRSSGLVGDDRSPYPEWIAELRALLRSGSRVLDLGCGAGVPGAKLLVQSGFEVTGLDFSRVQIERARHLVPQADFIEADMAEWSCEPTTFEAVVSFYALIHVPLSDQRALFPRIRRWLKPGGYFMAIVGHHRWKGVEEYYGSPMFG